MGSSKKKKSRNKSIKDLGSIGQVAGNLNSAGDIADKVRYNNPRGGHGFAAEQANHINDVLRGKNAEIVGNNNAKDGADRVITDRFTGKQTFIQTKYCSSGSKSVSECFRDGEFRYFDKVTGKPMQIEVPNDQYESAISAMENRIRTGQVEGVTDPSEAQNIIRKGDYTYQQAKNITQAGNIDSLKLDAKQGLISCGFAFGLSSLVTFGIARCNGVPTKDALKLAAGTGLKVGGVTFATSVLSNQIARIQIGNQTVNQAMRPATDYLVKQIGYKGSASLVNVFRSSSSAIHGVAATNHLSKLLRGNIITGAVTTVVTSIPDMFRLGQGRMSKSQFFKNGATNIAGVAGGTGGAIGGAKIGAIIGTFLGGPGVGTGVGTFLGGIIGGVGVGFGVGAGSKKVMDVFIKEDADEMIEILKEVYLSLANDFLISESESKEIDKRLKGKIDGSKLRDMYAESFKYRFAKNLLRPYFEEVCSERKRIKLPKEIELSNIIEDLIVDEMKKQKRNNTSCDGCDLSITKDDYIHQGGFCQSCSDGVKISGRYGRKVASF